MELPDLTKQYWVFEMEFYEPYGGLKDIRLTTDVLEIAKEHHAFSTYEEAYVFDSVERKVV